MAPRRGPTLVTEARMVNLRHQLLPVEAPIEETQRLRWDQGKKKRGNLQQDTQELTTLENTDYTNVTSPK